MTITQTATATKIPPEQGAATELPHVLVVGERDNTRAVERTLGQLDVAVKHYPTLDAARAALSQTALAIVLVYPLPEAGAVAAVATLAPRPTPVFVVVPDAYSDHSARELYAAGAAAVFEWPYEALVLPAMLTDLAGAVPHTPSSADARLTRVVSARLAQNIDGEIEAWVVGGTARVSGKVHSYWTKHRIQNILAHVPGITGVTTVRLEVVPTERSDHTVQQNARNLLRCLSGVDPKTVSVSVEGGVLSLAGTVGSHAGLERLESVLANVDGVRDIHNHVVVSRVATRQAHDLATRIESAVDAIWPDARARVTAFGSVVVLDGHARTLADKRAIGAFVRDTDGVDRVVNKLSVMVEPG